MVPPIFSGQTLSPTLALTPPTSSPTKRSAKKLRSYLPHLPVRAHTTRPVSWPGTVRTPLHHRLWQNSSYMKIILSQDTSKSNSRSCKTIALIQFLLTVQRTESSFIIIIFWTRQIILFLIITRNHHAHDSQHCIVNEIIRKTRCCMSSKFPDRAQMIFHIII